MLLVGEVRSFAATCVACELHEGRINPVFDKGNSEAKIMICGMVPAHNENLAGLPFVGRAGELLDTILNEVGLTYNDVYITNLVKCFVAAGRSLSTKWIESCRPFLYEQIRIIKPHVIITLGADASKELADTTMPISRMRGRIIYYSDNIILIPTFHPSYLLRGGGIKHKNYPDVIGDFKLAIEAKNENQMVK